MRRWALALAFLLPFAQAAQAQTTDHYALLMVWMPGLCKLEPDRAECKDLTLRRYDGLNLAFMALQSVRASNTSNTYCFTMPTDTEMDRGRRWCEMDAPNTRTDITAQLKKLMPVAQSCQDRGLWARFASCTLYSPDDYYSRAIRLATGVAGTAVNAKIAAAVGKTASLSALLEAFKADFGDESPNAIDFICRKFEGKQHLLQVRFTFTVRALTKGLSKEVLWKPQTPLRRGCPENFLVDEPPVPIAAPDQPAPSRLPAEPGSPDSAPVGPVETEPLEPVGPVVR
jgi:ribonuclease I